ncbi:MAG: protocatechuate 3,4-dioxygenase subunit beta [Roseobacter sp.]
MTEQWSFLPRNARRHPPALTPGYKSSVLRSPAHPPIALPNTVSEITGPVFGHGDIAPGDHDLLSNYARHGESPIGERILLHGRVLDTNARPVPKTLVEIWQANAGGRYRHRNDSYLAPLDPNFGGCGRALTDQDGWFAFQTVKPGAYPWPNGGNDWRPAHVHFSVFGMVFAQRLVTQCYFEGDPLINRCPIVQTIPDPAAVDQLTAKLDINATVPFNMIAYRLDIVLRGGQSTLFENRQEGN